MTGGMWETGLSLPELTFPGRILKYQAAHTGVWGLVGDWGGTPISCFMGYVSDLEQGSCPSSVVSPRSLSEIQILGLHPTLLQRSLWGGAQPSAGDQPCGGC